MNRGEFMAALARRLRHLPAGTRNEILADYQSYFAEGAAAGRSEQEIAESLGSPARLAAELSLEQAFEPRGGTVARPSALRTTLALLALAVIDGVAWLPLVIGVLVVLLAIAFGATALLYGAFTLVVDPFDRPLGGITGVLLRVLAYSSAGVAALALARAGVWWLARFFVRRHKQQRRVLRLTNEVSP